jgi:hypothetical protein
MDYLSFHFKSKPSIFFYFGIAFVLAILSYTGYNLSKHLLSLGSFLFLNILSFITTYVLVFRFSCSVDLTEKAFILKYYFKDEKSIQLSTDDIIDIQRHEDSVHRYFKKTLIITLRESFLIRYNISDKSDEDLSGLLRLIVEKHKIQASKLAKQRMS